MSTVQSIDRAFLILSSLAEKPGGISELSRRIDLPTSTVARLLSALEGSKVVERSKQGYEYQLGPKIMQLVTKANPGQALLSLARPFMVNLVDQLFEDVGLSIPTGYEVQYVGQVSCANPVQIRDWTGIRLPMHVVPSGLVVLAEWPEKAVKEFLRRHLEVYTPKTVVSHSKILERLARIRSDGFFWSYEEFSEGITSLAVPIFVENKSVVGSIHCHGPSYRFPQESTKETITALLVASAKEISRELGYKE